jgi:hypothetical protein
LSEVGIPKHVADDDALRPDADRLEDVLAFSRRIEDTAAELAFMMRELGLSMTVGS